MAKSINRFANRSTFSRRNISRFSKTLTGAGFALAAALPFAATPASGFVLPIQYASPGTPANTQQFSSIQAFGDSYVDIGNLFALVGPSAFYPTGRFSGGTNFIDTASALLGIPQANYAYGGAQAGSTNVAGPGLPGFAQQWQNFIATGRTFLPTDLVMLSVGGNDARAYELGGGTLAGAGAAASATAALANAGISALVGAGARTIVFTVGDVGQLPEVAGNPAAAVGTAVSQSYNLQMQASLGLLAASGVRVEYIDIGLIGQLIKANPGLYGVNNTSVCTVDCGPNSKSLFYFDGVHLTSLGFAIVGQYVVNRLNAPLTFAAQGDIGMSATMGFTSTMFGRLDLFGAQLGPSDLKPMAYAPEAGVKGPFGRVPAALPQSNPLSVYILVNGGFGSRKSSSTTNGYDWDSVGGTLGAEYRIGREGLIGVAFNYSNPTATFRNGAGKSDLDAYQFGIYGAWTRSNFFAQGLFSYGVQNYANMRPGVVSMINSAASGSSLSAAGKIGYLFDLGAARIGPIAGLTYASSQVNGYTETGDPVLTLALRRQKVEALVGSFGGQLRVPFVVAGNLIEPYLNLTAENDFRGNGRAIQYGATSAPLIINTWTIPKGSSSAYGRVTTGLTTDIGRGIGLSINLTQTFARKGGDDFGGSGGFKMAF